MEFIRREAATFAGFALVAVVFAVGAALEPDRLGAAGSLVALAVLFVVMLWCAFNVVHHAESLAELLGEPYGTLILTVSVIGIEVALIAAVMLTGGGNATVARDTMFSVLMIALNALVGLSLVMGGLRYRTQAYNLQGANAFLAVLLPLAILGLVLPRITTSAPDGELSLLQSVFLIAMSVVLYGIFLAIQTVTHSDIFRQPADAGADETAAHGHHMEPRGIPYHVAGLLAALLPIILLAKKLAVYIDFGIGISGAPLALSGLLVAAIILTPEALTAVQASRSNQLQRAVNISLGSALASIGMTIPAVLAIGWWTGATVELGLEATEIALLVLTLAVSIVTFVSPRTNMLQGVVHLALFAAYVMLIFDTAG